MPRRRVEDIEGNASKARRVAAKAPPISTAVPPGDEPLRATVDEIFRNHAIVTEAVKANVKTRTVVADEIAKRAKTAFANFSASSYSKEARAEKIYLRPEDDLAESLDFVMKNGAKALRPLGKGGIRLTESGALDKLIKDKHGGQASTIGTMEIDDLVDYVTRRLGVTPSRFSDPTLRSCNAESEAERRLAAIESEDDGGPAPAAGTTNGGAETTNGAAPAAGLSADKLAKSKVNLLMDTVVSPEKPIRIDPPDEPPEHKNEKAIGSVQTFELRDGPSDVTSYHDFNSLQIAFQHVWTEVFDRDLKSLGRELYQEFVRLKDFAGLDNGKDAPVDTISDLARLIGEVQELSRLTQAELPTGSSPGRDGSSNRDVPAGAHDLTDVVGDVLTGGFLGNDVAQWILNPAGAAVDFLSNLFAGKQQANWASFETGHTLPGGIDVITATFEENAAPAGTVEIVLTNSASASTWKGIDFYEIDSTGRPLNLFKIANDPRDRGVWDPQSFNKLPLYTQQVKNGVLEFGKEIMFGAHKAHYFLIGLDEKLKDRTRVTFYWQKDK